MAKYYIHVISNDERNRNVAYEKFYYSSVMWNEDELQRILDDNKKCDLYYYDGIYELQAWLWDTDKNSHKKMNQEYSSWHNDGLVTSIQARLTTVDNVIDWIEDTRYMSVLKFYQRDQIEKIVEEMEKKLEKDKERSL